MKHVFLNGLFCAAQFVANRVKECNERLAFKSSVWFMRLFLRIVFVQRNCSFRSHHIAVDFLIIGEMGWNLFWHSGGLRFKNKTKSVWRILVEQNNRKCHHRQPKSVSAVANGKPYSFCILLTLHLLLFLSRQQMFAAVKSRTFH